LLSILTFEAKPGIYGRGVADVAAVHLVQSMPDLGR
jgi:hypothetical protein